MTSDSHNYADQPEPRRKTLRLGGFRYRGGQYYITQAAQNRQRLFGTLIDGRMMLSPAGQMLYDVLHEIPQHCPAYALDECIVMPDHVHFIVNTADDDSDVRYHDYRDIAVGVPLRGHPSLCGHPRRGAPTLFDFMHRFKSLTTARYRHGVIEQGWRRFESRIWQREYYEHIVRSAADLERIRKYIRDNPKNANLLRFGELCYYGNRELLKLRKTAFLASRSNNKNAVGAPLYDHVAGAPLCGRPQDRARTEACPDEITNAQCVISGFLSPREREVLRYCRAHSIPTIHVSCRGAPPWAPSEARVPTEGYPDNNNTLIITPFDESVGAHGGAPRLNAERAAWCNQYALHNADEIVIGYLNPDGMLAFLLTDLANDTPVTIISKAAAAGSTDI